MAKRWALRLLVLATLLVAGAYLAAFLPGGAPAWAAWLMAIGTASMMVAAMALGAASARGLGRLLFPFALVFVILAGGFGLALTSPKTASPADPLWLGLPRAAAIIVYGVGLLPLFVVPIAYALTFDESTLREEDLERIRRAAAQREA